MFDELNPTNRGVFVSRFGHPDAQKIHRRMTNYITQLSRVPIMDIDYREIELRVLATSADDDFACRIGCGCHKSPAGRNYPDRACGMCLTLLCGY